MKNHTLSTLADEVYGGTAAEIAAFAKEHGFMPDKTGLIEFPKPVTHEVDRVTGEKTPVLEIVSVEDATPATDEELEQMTKTEQAEEGSASTATATVQAQSGTLYGWNYLYGSEMGFPIGYHTPPQPSPEGHQGYSMDRVRLYAYIQPTLGHSAQTGYNTMPYAWTTGNQYIWSPVRAATQYNRLLFFSQRVYGSTASVWWT